MNSVFQTLLYPLTWLLDHTIYYIFKGIFFVIDAVLPDTYTSVVTEFSTLFWNGIKTTMFVALFGTILGFLIACVCGTLRTITIKEKDHVIVKVLKWILQAIIKTYVTVFRGTPMIVQAMIIYYGLYKVLRWDPFDAALITVTINTGAYLTEVIRESLESVDKGQAEASRSLGFGFIPTLIYTVFPQALKNAMAAIGNEFVINIKDTSVLNVIGCCEMYFVLRQASGKYYFYMETMVTGAIIYLILTYSITKLLNYITKKLDAPAQELHGSN